MISKNSFALKLVKKLYIIGAKKPQGKKSEQRKMMKMVLRIILFSNFIRNFRHQGLVIIDHTKGAIKSSSNRRFLFKSVKGRLILHDVCDVK